MKRAFRQNRLDPGLKAWIRNTARKNYWRIPHWYDLEDLIQEGRVCYWRCMLRYATTVKNQAHFTALVKIVFINRIHDLAKEKTRAIDEPLVLGRNKNLQDEIEELLGPEPSHEGNLVLLLWQLPTELLELLVVLFNDARRIPHRQFSNGARESNNRYLARIGGLPKDTDVEGLLREHFAL